MILVDVRVSAVVVSVAGVEWVTQAVTVVEGRRDVVGRRHDAAVVRQGVGGGGHFHGFSGNLNDGRLHFGDGRDFGGYGQVLSLGAVSVLIGHVVDGVRVSLGVGVTVSTHQSALD